MVKAELRLKAIRMMAITAKRMIMIMMMKVTIMMKTKMMKMRTMIMINSSRAQEIRLVAISSQA